MLKLIFNEDFSHAMMSSSFSQSTTFQIDHYSTHATSMNFNIDAASIANLVYFENTKINSIRIMDGTDLLMNLNLNNIEVFILSYNTNLYDGGQSTNVNMGQVQRTIPEPENIEPEGEGE